MRCCAGCNAEVRLAIDPGLHLRGQVYRHPNAQHELRRNRRQRVTMMVVARVGPGSAGLGPARADAVNIDRRHVLLVDIKPGGRGEND